MILFKFLMKQHRKKVAVYVAVLLMLYILYSLLSKHYILIYSHALRGIKYISSTRWEESVQGTNEDCRNVLSIVENESALMPYQLVNENQNLVHPIFGKFLIEQLDLQGLSLEIICKRVEKTNKLFDLAKPLKENSLVSASKSYFLVKQKSIPVGQTIEVTIFVRDQLGGDTTHAGGDFFKITAETATMGARIAAADISYLGTGVYVANIKTQWAGPHHIKVMFGNSGHFVGLIAGATATGMNDSPTMVFNAEYKFENTRERSRCSIVPFASSKFLCNYTNHNGEKWFCSRPDALSCRDIDSLFVTRKTTVLELANLFPADDR